MHVKEVNDQRTVTCTKRGCQGDELFTDSDKYKGARLSIRQVKFAHEELFL